ncbi:MAG: tetratricopeptide repeat protein, partial [Pirellulales bacterium]
MDISRPTCFAPYRSLLVRGIVPLILVCGLCSNALGQGQVSIPSQPYFLALPAFYNGQYAATNQIMITCLQGAIKNPAVGGLWIDSICYQTLLGECAYHMGNHPVAQAHYEAALQLLISFNNWMLAVQFPAVVVPQALKPIPWYLTTRPTVIGGYPPTMNIMQIGAAAVPNAVRIQPVLVPIYAQEIVRCSCLAIRRYGELLGPACPHSLTTKRLVQVLGQRPALPNHWSEAWVDTEYGLALAAAGQTEQARKTLAQAERAMGFDHPFTGTVLLQSGLLDLQSGDYKAAHRNFLEASWAAANYNDFGVVEEALRYATIANYLVNGRMPYALLAPAVTWAAAGVGGAGTLVQLNTSLLLDSADNAAQCNQPALATGFLGQATVLASGTNMLAGKIGARMNHLKALVAYQLGNTAGGDLALGAAMLFQTGGSLRLYHVAAAEALWNTRDATGFTERMAVDLYGTVLRDPTPADWMINPLESLTMMVVPHPLPYENWFDAALARRAKDHELALQITDMARRHRFLSTLTLDHGGRLLNLRWLLEAPEKALDQTALMQRQALEVRFPAYVEKSQRVRKLRNELRRLPLMTDEQEVAEQQSQMLKELATLSGEQEVLLRQMSVGREPANLVFPPLRSFKQVQDSLTEGQSLLVFFDTSRYTYSFLIEKDKYNYNEVKPPKNFRTNIRTMLQNWGNFTQNKEM